MENKSKQSFNANETQNTTSQNESDGGISSIPAFNVIYGLVFGIICVVGIIGNIMVLVVVKRKRSMRSTTNFLLANLATADLLSLLGAIPVVSQIYFEHPDGQVGHYLCIFFTAGNVSVIALITSVITLAMLAFERYMALLKPMKGVRLNDDTVYYAIMISWTISVAFAVPFFLRTTEGRHSGIACIQEWKSPAEKWSFLGVFFVFLFIIPYVLITFCYGAIIKGIYFSHAICPMDVGANDADHRSKRRIVEVLLIVTLMFTICVGSFAIVNTLREIGIIQNDNRLYHVTAALLFANSSINPLVYAFRSSNYKRAFKEILGFRTDSSTYTNGME